MKLNIIDIASHRNGICGAPFAVVLFEDGGGEGTRKVAILFDAEYHCAVLDVAKLAANDIVFGSNSWRGDNFERTLRAATTARLGTETVPIDIDRILAERKEIAVTWSIADVKGIRPDLNDEQCWEVLEVVKRKHDADWGICRRTLEESARILFGDVPETGETKEV